MVMNKSTNKLTNRYPTANKLILHRITALLLALTLALAVMPSVIVRAENNSRAIDFDFSCTVFVNDEIVESLSKKANVAVTGNGKFVARSIYLNDEYGNGSAYGVRCYLFSDSTFSIKSVLSDGSINEYSSSVYNGIYYFRLFDCVWYSGYSLDEVSFTYRGCPNVSHAYSADPHVISDYYKYIIDSGSLDLSKDDYLSDDDKASSASYNKDLDFASISADYKVKYTIEKDSNGHWDFVTPDEAGIQFDWINRTDIDGAYVKFNVYGEYYDSFWSTSYTNTYVTLTCERKNDLSYLCLQKDMLSLAKEKVGGSKGYGFVVNYIYVQAFAEIDGVLCRSRIYKFNSDLISDYGNADSEDDEWFPEITDGTPMPDDYEPDPDNSDPEKTEPAPDPDDDTIIDTPVDDDTTFEDFDVEAFLELFKQFSKGLMQGCSYLGIVPTMIKEVFGFLPTSIISFIGFGFLVAIVLRVLGR